MRILTIHADFIEYETQKKAVKDAETGKEGKNRIEECLVVLTAVEKGDGKLEGERAVREVISIAEQVKAKTIVLYPWVHLTNEPSKPQEALDIMKQMEGDFKKTNYAVHRAPFGWYKSFDLKCKGHPLSELSRVIKGALEEGKGKEAEGKEEKKRMERESASLKKEEKMKSTFCVLTPEGDLIPYESFDFSKHASLGKFFNYEVKKARAYEQEPPHIRLMKEHLIADNEEGSDAGNMRWYGRGRFIKKQLSNYVSSICLKEGAMEVETPVMYDFEHPSLKKYLNRFPARQYVVVSDEKEYFLRFAACFGQFLMAHDMVISYKNLPLKMYELTRYSFRRDQSGELCGLKRLRAFTMPDMHTFAKDLLQAKEEFRHQYDVCMEFLKDLGIEFEAGFRVLKEFFEENREFYVDMARTMGKPVMVEIFDERYAYFITKFEFNYVDNMDKASALSTVQIDVENSETYDISFVDENNAKKRPLILHASISGSIERVIFALLETEAEMMGKGKRGMINLWLAPTQVRVIPVSQNHFEKAKKIMEKIEKENVRVDIDDNEDTLQKRIRNAEMEWINYIVIVGEKESEETLAVRVRRRDGFENKTMGTKEIADEINKKTVGKPFSPIPLNKFLSKRVKER